MDRKVACYLSTQGSDFFSSNDADMVQKDVFLPVWVKISYQVLQPSPWAEEPLQ